MHGSWRPRKKHKTETGPRGKTSPLHISARSGDLESIGSLLADYKSRGLESAVDAVDEHGRTSLHLACWAGKGAAVAALLEGGADASLGAQDAMTALHFASQAGCGDAVDALVGAGADLDCACTKSLKTPLHMAAAKGHAAVVAKLVAAGADATKNTRQGETPLGLAKADDVKAAFSTPRASPPPEPAPAKQSEPAPADDSEPRAGDVAEPEVAEPSDDADPDDDDHDAFL